MPKPHPFTRYRRMLWYQRKRFLILLIISSFILVIRLLFLTFGYAFSIMSVNAMSVHALADYQDKTRTYEKLTSVLAESVYSSTMPFLLLENDEEQIDTSLVIAYEGMKTTLYYHGENEEDENHPVVSEAIVPISSLSFEEIRSNYFFVDASTTFPAGIVSSEYLLNSDYSIKKTSNPQILIFHTHYSEGYSDSRADEPKDTVVGVGSYLTELLEAKGYVVIHDTSPYDVKNGVVNRDVSYSQALKGISRILEENPTIEVIIDLHRDSGNKRVWTYCGENAAQIMLFNGMSRTSDGPITYLPNENLPDNLGFSFQTKVLADMMYPGFMKRIYLKSYRYNMHLVKRDLLVEVGTVNNTVAEAYLCMEPFAEVLDCMLRGESGK